MVKILSNEQIQRIASKRKSVGGGGSVNSGGVSAGWVDENYLSKEYFLNIFTIHTKITTVVTDDEGQPVGDPVISRGTLYPNTLPGTTSTVDEYTGLTTTVTTEIADVEVSKGLWTESFLSALGLNSAGGGGGTVLNEPLASINAAGLAAHPSSSGMTVVWNGSAWVYGTAGSSSSGTVTRVATGTGLTGGPITSSGTIAISSEYQTKITHGETAYNWGDHSDAGYLTGITSSMVTNALGFTPLSNATTFWGQTINNGVVNGNMTDVGSITMRGNLVMNINSLISSGGNNILQYDGNQTALNYGYRSTKPAQIYGTEVQFLIGTSIVARVYNNGTDSGLRIGDGMIVWDATNNALKVQKYDGTSANIYATGGVTALSN